VKTRDLSTASLVVATLLVAGAGQSQQRAPSAETVSWFQATEQRLMGSIASGDETPWERVMDPSCVLTTEEGGLMTRQQFLNELRPLPPGLEGEITVKELTVKEFPGFAIVRFLADEFLRHGRARPRDPDPRAPQVRAAGVDSRGVRAVPGVLATCSSGAIVSTVRVLAPDTRGATPLLHPRA